MEIQRSDRDNHAKRVRFNASVITAKESAPGEHFEDILELCATVGPGPGFSGRKPAEKAINFTGLHNDRDGKMTVTGERRLS